MEASVQSIRNGWQKEETEKLWEEINQAAENGAPLRGVFEKMGKELGRKPNSVRNYYYMQLRSRGGEQLRRAAPFETFTEEEIHDLLRSVLSAKGKGQSVRACVMQLSGGDKALMLRFQNKYRSVLRKRPDLIRQVCRELEAEGKPFLNPIAEMEIKKTREETLPGETMPMAEDPDVQAILCGVRNILARCQPASHTGDRLRVQRDLLLMQLEDIQLVSRDLIGDCKEFLGAPPEIREMRMQEFCQSLSEHVARLESVSG